MSGEALGQFIAVDFQDNDCWIVRGHVTPIEAHLVATSYGLDTDVEVDAIYHTWARWIPDSTGEYDVRLWEAQRGHGAFAVTVGGNDCWLLGGIEVKP